MIPIGRDPEPWVASVPNVKFDLLRQYAEQVYADTGTYLATLSAGERYWSVRWRRPLYNTRRSARVAGS
jgi:hypothetical protein